MTVTKNPGCRYDRFVEEEILTSLRLNPEKLDLTEGSFRGQPEIAGALLESSIFENCWPARLSGRIGLEAEFQIKGKNSKELSSLRRKLTFAEAG